MYRIRIPDHSWLMVALLFLFMLVNFADKAVIGIAAVPMMHELRLSPREFGLIGSSFFLLFPVSAVITGFIVNRVQTRWALLVMALVWALTQFPMLGTVGFTTVVACRVALGAGEGPAYPVALHSAYKWFPNELRTLPTAVIAQGAGIGIMVALPLLNWVIVRYSWHWAFGVLGITGLAWSAAWFLLGREGPLTTPRAIDAHRVAYGQLLFSPTVIASWCASFGAQWGLSQALSWQGAFLIKGLGFTQGSIGLLGALPAAGYSRQGRADDDRGSSAFGHLRDRQCRGQRNRTGRSARCAARDRHCCQHLGRDPRPLCHGQRRRGSRNAARRLQHRFHDLRSRHAGRRYHSHGACAPRA